jgi:hypothetical protein
MYQRLIAAALSGFTLGLGTLSSLAAEGVMITADSAADVKVRLDGVPSELPGAWSTLNLTKSGKRANKASAQVALAYDDENLYVAMRIEDSKIVRTAAAGPGDDHATLYLAFPVGRGRYRTHVVDLFPGDPGKLPGVVMLGGQRPNGAQLVEAPEAGGLTFEAKIPWKTFPEAGRTRIGLRAGVQWTDAVTPSRIASVTATTPGKEGKELPALLTEPEQALFDGLIRAQSLPTEPSREIFADLAGDSLLERVALYDHFLTVVGPHFRGGKEFVVADLQVQDAGKVRRLQAADFDGDGHEEVVTVVRIGSEDHYRDVVEVLRMDSDNTLKPVFLHEVGLATASGTVNNDVQIGKSGSHAILTIAQGSADGVEQEGYSEPKPSDMDSALLPWDKVGSLSFGWQGGHLVKVSETEQTPKSKGTAKRDRVHEQRTEGHHAAPSVASPPAPRAPSTDEMQEQVYALYRKDRHVKKGKPRFDFVTDVAGDTVNERVLVHDRDIVCFGKNFHDGNTYVYTSIGVASADDILDMTARDLTGDGKAEIIVLAALHGKAGKELDDVDVDRSVMYVYQISESGIHRIFAAETGRMLNDKLVLTGIRFVPQPVGTAIEMIAGRAVGFTAKSYPFPSESEGNGGVEPIVLPWSKGTARSYRFDGTRFTLQ